MFLLWDRATTTLPPYDFREKYVVKGNWSTYLPTVSLTAESCPFFFVHTYFPLLALSATLCPRHSMSNIVLISLKNTRQGFRLKCASKPLKEKFQSQRKSLLTFLWQWIGSLRGWPESSTILRWFGTWLSYSSCQSPFGTFPSLSLHPDWLKYWLLVIREEKTVITLVCLCFRNVTYTIVPLIIALQMSLTLLGMMRTDLCTIVIQL